MTLRTYSGVMRLMAPALSSGPNSLGHQFSSNGLSLGGGSAYCAPAVPASAAENRHATTIRLTELLWPMA